MRVNRWGSLLVAAGTVAGTVVGLTSSAGAASSPQTLTIGVGGDRVVSGVTVEGMRFDAPTLNVHKGDTLTFKFNGFHTATALPQGDNPTDWRAQNMGPGGPFSLVQPDSDDSPPAFEFNKAVLFGNGADGCGGTTNACPYDGDLLNSGVPIAIQSFSMTVTTNPNTSFWVICLLHGMMQLQVNVVPDSSPATTQAAVDGYAKSTLASDNEQAAALIPKLQVQTSHKVGHHKVVDAFAGFDGDGFGLDGMFPNTIHIKKGQFVRWHFSQLMDNIHTVTFPRSAAISFEKDFSGGNMKCEGASGDTTTNAPPPVFCNPGGPGALEVELRAGAVAPVGGHKYAGHGVFSSGVRGLETGNAAPYTLRFTKKSGKHGFRYACNVHGGMMSGRVIVKK